MDILALVCEAYRGFASYDSGRDRAFVDRDRERRCRRASGDTGGASLGCTN